MALRILRGHISKSLRIPVRYTLGPDYLDMELLVSEIVDTEANVVHDVGVLPFLGAAPHEEPGYLFVPDGSGATIDFDSTRYMYQPYRQQVYGRDLALRFVSLSRFVEYASVPVFGVKHEDHALLGVITAGESLARIITGLSRNQTSYNHVYPEFRIRAMDTYPLGGANNPELRDIAIFERGERGVDVCSVRYYPLGPDEADYVDMARRYRRHLVEEMGFTDRPEDSDAFYLDVVGAVPKVRPVLGIPMERPETLTSFDDAVAILENLREGGVESVVLRYINWMDEPIERELPVTVDFTRADGTRRDFERSLEYAEATGVAVYPSVDFVRLYESRAGYSTIFHSSRNIGRGPARQREFLRSTYEADEEAPSWVPLKPQKVPEAVAEFRERYTRYENPRVALESLPSTVYSDFSAPKHTRNRTRGMWEETLHELDAAGFSVLGETVFAYALPYVDHIVGMPADSSGFDVESDRVPFLHIVLHDLVPYAVRPINLESDPETALLRAVETCSFLHYTWVYRDPSRLKATEYDHLFSPNFRGWIDEAVAHYRRVKEVHETTEGPIVGHRVIGEDLRVTRYENGVWVVVNYGEETATVNGVTVPARDFRLVRAEETGS